MRQSGRVSESERQSASALWWTADRLRDEATKLRKEAARLETEASRLDALASATADGRSLVGA